MGVAAGWQHGYGRLAAVEAAAVEAHDLSRVHISVHTCRRAAG